MLFKRIKEKKLYFQEKLKRALGQPPSRKKILRILLLSGLSIGFLITYHKPTRNLFIYALNKVKYSSINRGASPNDLSSNELDTDTVIEKIPKSRKAQAASILVGAVTIGLLFVLSNNTYQTSLAVQQQPQQQETGNPQTNDVHALLSIAYYIAVQIVVPLWFGS
jgi:hypothetical protein